MCGHIALCLHADTLCGLLFCPLYCAVFLSSSCNVLFSCHSVVLCYFLVILLCCVVFLSSCYAVLFSCHVVVLCYFLGILQCCAVFLSYCCAVLSSACGMLYLCYLEVWSPLVLLWHVLPSCASPCTAQHRTHLYAPRVWMFVPACTVSSSVA